MAWGMAVDVARGLVVVSGESDDTLYVYSLADGSLVRSFGGKGAGKGQFHFSSRYGGLCMTPRGTLLVAECSNNRVQEVTVDDGSWVRFVGEGVNADYVTCSESVIAVAETIKSRVVLLSWADGSLLGQFGGEGSGDGQLKYPRGLRLLADGRGVVVADQGNNRLCFFTATGDFVRSLSVGLAPLDVVEVDGGANFVVVDHNNHTVSKVSGLVGEDTPFGGFGSGDGQFYAPVVLATVTRGGSDSGVELVVLEHNSKRFQVFRA